MVEEQPGFEGGMDAFYKYVGAEIRYPLSARSEGIEGRLFAQFVIERDGSIANIEVLKGIHEDCNQEAIRVMESVTGFKAGSQRGRSVRTKMLLPIQFKISKGEINPDGSPQGMVILDVLMTNGGELVVEAEYESGVWSGKVMSPEGDVLPGTNIVVEGTTRGTVADLEGTFTINAEKSEVLKVSFVGYESVSIRN